MKSACMASRAGRQVRGMVFPRKWGKRCRDRFSTLALAYFVANFTQRNGDGRLPPECFHPRVLCFAFPQKSRKVGEKLFNNNLESFYDILQPFNVMILVNTTALVLVKWEQKSMVKVFRQCYYTMRNYERPKDDYQRTLRPFTALHILLYSGELDLKFYDKVQHNRTVCERPCFCSDLLSKGSKSCGSHAYPNAWNSTFWQALFFPQSSKSALSS